MSAKEGFEVWWAKDYGYAFNDVPGSMGLAFKEVAEKSWKASRVAALKEIAAMAEVYLADHGIEQARACLPDAIRALAKAEGD